MSNELNKCYICDKEFDQLEIHFLRLHAFEGGLVEDANEKENITGKNLRPEIKKLHTIEDNNKIVQESKNLTVHKNIHEGENKSYNSETHPCDICDKVIFPTRKFRLHQEKIHHIVFDSKLKCHICEKLGILFRRKFWKIITKE